MLSLFCEVFFQPFTILAHFWQLFVRSVQHQNTAKHYYTVSQKNDTDVTHYRFNPHQPISVIFGRDVAERVCYRMVIYYPTSPN